MWACWNLTNATFCLILAPHSLLFFLSVAAVWDKPIISVYSSYSFSTPGLLLKAIHFSSSVSRSPVLDLRLFVYFVLFSVKQLSLL